MTDFDEDLQEARNLYEKILNGTTNATNTEPETLLTRIQSKIDSVKSSLSPMRTAKLWLIYMDMVDILKKFIEAERTGNWHLHLQTVKEMLPFFAASGHNMYAKSAYLYLQSMLKLEEHHPGVYLCFLSGHHVIRRSDRFWSGLSSDLVIEQVLMRSVKSTGGMTRGHGPQRAEWLLSMPVCVEMNNAMQTFSSVDYHASDQHKDSTESRKARDDQDSSTVLSFLEDRCPFGEDITLYNVVTGVTADKSVNVENSREIGRHIIESMCSENVLNYTFRKANQAITMSTKITVKNNSLHVDPDLLFQRLVTVADNLVDNMSDIFKYELCSHPTSMFDQSGLMREAQKPGLADAVWKLTGDDVPPELTDKESMQYVLDGGSLLQRLPWVNGSTYASVCQVYIDYIKKKYVDPIIVFDGYSSGPSTKDTTHIRRGKGKRGPKIRFTGDTVLKVKKELFLSNTENKQLFIDMLSSKMIENGLKIVKSLEDADVSIVQTAVASANDVPTIVIGEDTDLLVLLCFHANVGSKDLIFKSEVVRKSPRVWKINSVKTKLGEATCKNLLLVHAITGCDTTSRLFGIGKASALQKLVHNQSLAEYIEVFFRQSTKEEVVRAGERIIVNLYGGSEMEGLDELRYKKFSQKVASSTTSVQVHCLPPTSAAACHHSLRVYYQVHQWMGLDDLNPCDWGWTVDQDRLLPIKTSLPPAPERLLTVIRCKCKTACDSKRCSCRKHGLSCSSCCEACCAVSCENSPHISTDELTGEL